MLRQLEEEKAMEGRVQTNFSPNKTTSSYTHLPFFQEVKFIIFNHELAATESSFTPPSKPLPFPKNNSLTLGSLPLDVLI
jgi:hypothetical protein